jgi:hypothetical protein
MNRPTGVTVISVLYFISACLTLFVGVAFAIGGSLVKMFLRDADPRVMTMIASAGIIVAVVCFFVALIPIIVGWGLWSLKEWARVTAIVLSSIVAALRLLRIFLLLLHFNVLGIIASLIVIAIHGWIIFYLLKPHVKTAFGAA